MRSLKLIFICVGLLVVNFAFAQHIQLLENRGEIGLMGGGSYYRGDIASDKLFYSPNAGIFYKKQLNDYVGLRLTYEYISIGANDLQSDNVYDHKRALYFARNSHDVSLMGEFYFLRFINGNRNYRFTPYLGFGIGAWKSINGLSNLDSLSTSRTILFPINLGLKYNITGPWNIFGEITYRFTSSDNIDYFNDQAYYKPLGSATTFQASTSGNDQYFSAKLGVSYNLLKVYGIENKKAPKRSFFGFGKEKQPKSDKKGLFSFLKRK